MTESKFKKNTPELHITTRPRSNFAKYLTKFPKAIFGKTDELLSVETANHKGSRDYQEDSVIAGCVPNTDINICIITDGMGGHSSGDIASKVVSKIVFDKLTTEVHSQMSAKDIQSIMLDCVHKANAEITKLINEFSVVSGMGTTLVVGIIKDHQLHWVSVGDSPLYLFRNNKLIQVNEDHSMAPQIDEMAVMGVISKEAAENHKDRNCLTSALMGEEISRIDVCENPIDLNAKDILIVSSDGLQYLSETEIINILKTNVKSTALEIKCALLNALLTLRDPLQDNIGFCVARYCNRKTIETMSDETHVTQFANKNDEICAQ